MGKGGIAALALPLPASQRQAVYAMAVLMAQHHRRNERADVPVAFYRPSALKLGFQEGVSLVICVGKKPEAA